LRRGVGRLSPGTARTVKLKDSSGRGSARSNPSCEAVGKRAADCLRKTHRSPLVHVDLSLVEHRVALVPLLSFSERHKRSHVRRVATCWTRWRNGPCNDRGSVRGADRALRPALPISPKLAGGHRRTVFRSCHCASLSIRSTRGGVNGGLRASVCGRCTAPSAQQTP